MNKRQILTTAVLAVGGLGLAAAPAWAQQQDQQAQQQQQQQQPGAGQSSADPSSTAQPAADRASSAGQATRSDAQQALSQVATGVLTKDGSAKLSDALTSADKQRIGDWSQQAQQIDQSAEQLRQAFKAKYNQDLDVSASADRIFSSTFIQIGGAADAAQAASGRLSPDSSAAQPGAGATAQPGAPAQPSDAARQADAASAARANADAAETAGSRSMQATTVTIPESHGAQATRLSLVQEGGQWKIDLPDSVDGKQLAQNIQQHLQMAAQAKDKWPADATEGQQAIVHHVLMAFAHTGASGASGTPGARDASGRDTSGARDATGLPRSDTSTTPGSTGTSGAAGTSGTSR